ncbi:MAG: helix-turn-helix transcriptional regulator [Oscillospiraceae bacterium]|nr:helix-turn-helix transcriptional regulator [Oscillospiraceae bacterium]
MSAIFSYRDEVLYSHHTVDLNPDRESFSMHAHEWMEIYYCISGQGTYLVEGQQYPLEAGDIFIMRAAEAHKLKLQPDTPYDRIAIHFSPSLLLGLDPDGHLLRPFLDRPLGQHNRYSVADDPKGRLRAAFADFDFTSIPDVRLHLTARLLLFLTTLNGMYEPERYAAPVGGLSGELVAYVNEHLFEDMTVQSVADAFYRSRSQVNRIFRQATGSSLWKYVTIKRLMAARAMIQRGESAGTACEVCGFSDYSAFYRLYRTQFGHAPREDAGTAQ